MRDIPGLDVLQWSGRNKSPLALQFCSCMFLSSVSPGVRELPPLISLPRPNTPLSLWYCQAVCTMTTAFLHFFFLASFCWVLTEAWQSYMAVTGKVRTRLIRKRFLCLGWGEYMPLSLSLSLSYELCLVTKCHFWSQKSFSPTRFVLFRTLASSLWWTRGVVSLQRFPAKYQPPTCLRTCTQCSGFQHESLL